MPPKWISLLNLEKILNASCWFSKDKRLQASYSLKAWEAWARCLFLTLILNPKYWKTSRHGCKLWFLLHYFNHHCLKVLYRHEYIQDILRYPFKMFTMLNQQLFMLFKLMVAHLVRVISHADCLLHKILKEQRKKKMEGDQVLQMGYEIEILGSFLDPNPLAFLITMRVKRLQLNEFSSPIQGFLKEFIPTLTTQVS